MANIASILKSFECGAFYNTSDSNYPEILSGGAQNQLNDILIWVNANLTSCLLNEVRYYDAKKISECLDLASNLKDKFAQIVLVLKNQHPVRNQQKYSVLCKECKYPAFSGTSRKLGYWRDLQDHEHIEVALTSILNPNTLASVSEPDSLENYSSSNVSISDGNEPETSPNGESLINSIVVSNDHLSEVHTSPGLECLCATNNSFKLNFTVDHDTRNHLEISSANGESLINSIAVPNDHLPEVHTSPGLECRCATNNSFKFNFTVDHDTRNHLEISSANGESLINSIAVPNDHLPEVHNSPCVECCCATNNSFKFNFTVDYDTRIKKLLYGNLKYLEAVEIYGVIHSAIQFKDPNIFTCLLCNIEAGHGNALRTIREHIRGQRHQKYKTDIVESFLKTYHINWMKLEMSYQAHQTHFVPDNISITVCRVCCLYVDYEDLQTHIRSETHMGHVMKLYKKDSRSTLLQLQASVYLPDLIHSIVFGNKNGIGGTSRQRITSNMEEEMSDSDDSADKPENLQGKQKHVHNIITSIANPSGKSLSDVLEHRFAPHLTLIRVVSDTKLECICCKVLLTNQSVNVKEHLCSKCHISKCNLPTVKWQLYCEICDFSCLNDVTWKNHLSDTKHVECCNNLGLSRKAKICEYECSTCKVIIFGDDLSIKRHVKGRRQRKKAIVLNNEVKEVFKTEQIIKLECGKLVTAANAVLFNPAPMSICCKALEKALSEVFPRCKVFPFGSRVSGLGNEKSDLDVFVDVGDMYLGMKDQDAPSQEQFVKAACRILRKKRGEFSHLNPIPTARTPIIQIFHRATSIDCDLSFRHGLSVENSKFLRFCIEIQPVTQALILMLKKWNNLTKLNENITTYALSMMVIYFLQVKNYLLPVHELKLLNPNNLLVIDGWSITDFSTLHNVTRSRITLCNKPIKQVLIEFFDFYKIFDYDNDVVCTLLGHPIKKSLFLNTDGKENLPLEMLSYVQKLSNPYAEVFRAKSHFCIQDPFDLSHNLVKACSQGTVHKLIAYCDLTSKHIKTIP